MVGGEDAMSEYHRIRRIKYGKYSGHFKWDLAVAWFQTSNDAFYNVYGFNFVPKGELFTEAKAHVTRRRVL